MEVVNRRIKHAIAGVGIATALALAPSASAAPGNPGVPGAPTVVFEENFENVPNPAAAQLLADYVGAPPTSMTYTAHPDWLDSEACNGVIASWNATTTAGSCPDGIYDGFIRPIARGMGEQLGGGDDNQVMSDVTISGFPAAATPAATLETETPISLPSANRYITFSIDAGAVSCEGAQPLLRFFLLNGNDALPITNNAINACTDPRGTDVSGVRVGSYASDDSILFSGTSLGVRLTNDQTSGNGNDYAVDNLRVLDATPQVDKEFESPASRGVPTTLTFTITNTSDLAAKEGWSFTDTLPAGLEVADPAGTTTNCANGSIAATAGDDAIEVAGDLETNRSSCTATVEVVANEPGDYENCAANVSDIVGLDPPACDTLRVLAPNLDLKKRASKGRARPGEVLSYKITLRNRGDGIANDVRVCDRVPASLKVLRAPGADRRGKRRVCWDVDGLAAGAKKTFRIVVQVKDSAKPGKRVRNVAVAEGANGETAKAGDKLGIAPTGDDCPRFARC